MVGYIDLHNETQALSTGGDSCGISDEPHHSLHRMVGIGDGNNLGLLSYRYVSDIGFIYFE